MIYMKSADGALKVIVLELANLEELKAGRPARSPDGSVLIAFTPDPVWLAGRLVDCDGDLEKVAALIDEAAKRPQAKPLNPADKKQFIKFKK